MRFISVAAACGVLLVSSAPVFADGLPVSFGANAAFNSKYIWRGFNVNDDPVFQPDVWLSYKGLTLDVWGNMDLTDIHDNEGEFNEIDYTVDYSWDWNKLGFSAGAIHYEFPNTAFDSTSEVYGAVGYDTILSPTLTVYYDFDEADGFYGTFGLSHSFEVPKVIDGVSASLDLSGEVGFASANWNDFYYGADHTAFDNLLVTAAFPVAIGGHVTVGPSVSYSTTLDDTLASKADDDHVFIWGATVGRILMKGRG